MALDESQSTVAEAPGEEALEDELVVFGAGSEHQSLYQQLTDEADEAWKDLYDRKYRSDTFLPRVECSFPTPSIHCPTFTRRGCPSAEPHTPYHHRHGWVPRSARRLSSAALSGKLCCSACKDSVLTATSQNYLRMSLSPERYKPIIRADLLEYEHLNHCIDSIRQSLMCVFPYCGAPSIVSKFPYLGALRTSPSTFGNGPSTMSLLLAA